MRRWARVLIKTRLPAPNYRMAVLRESASRRGGVRMDTETGRFEPVPDRGPWQYVAITLDRWLSAQGYTRRQAVHHLRCVVSSCWAHGWARKYKPAPAYYQQLWKGRHLWTGTEGVRLPDRPKVMMRAEAAKARRAAAAKRQAKVRPTWQRWDGGFHG